MLPLFSERLTVDATRSLNCFLYILSAEVKSIVKEKRNDVEITLKTDLEASRNHDVRYRVWFEQLMLGDFSCVRVVRIDP